MKNAKIIAYIKEKSVAYAEFRPDFVFFRYKIADFVDFRLKNRQILGLFRDFPLLFLEFRVHALKKLAFHRIFGVFREFRLESALVFREIAGFLRASLETERFLREFRGFIRDFPWFGVDLWTKRAVFRGFRSDFLQTHLFFAQIRDDSRVKVQIFFGKREVFVDLRLKCVFFWEILAVLREKAAISQLFDAFFV